VTERIAPDATDETTAVDRAVEDARATDSTPPDTSAPDGASEQSTSTQLEEEGEIAADYIEELLDITDLDGDIEIDTRGGRAYVSVNSSEDTNLRLLSRENRWIL
jgi:spoIIIJ-associated protein